jgi:hypothetical protein
MITNERISRKQRLKAFGRRKTGIAIVLALVLITLVIIKTYQGKFSELLNESFVGDIFRGSYAENLDSLAIRVGHSFLLNNHPESSTVSGDSAGISYRRVRQPWPSALPLIFYSRSIQNVCDKYGIKYSCVIYGIRDSLVCELQSGNHNRLDITVIPGKKTRLDKRSIGIILKNIYELDNRDIIKIIDSRIPFGYLATIDVFPAGDIKRRLRSNRVASVISVSASRRELARRAVSGGRAESEYQKYVSHLLNLHPNLAFVDIERSDDIDQLFVKVLIDEAKKKGIDYIYRNSVPDGIDSLAYGAGLTFITYSKITDYTKMGFRGIRSLLTSELILSEKPLKMIISVDISNVGVDDLIDLMKYLKSLGINVLYLNKLSDDPDFTTVDL